MALAGYLLYMSSHFCYAKEMRLLVINITSPIDRLEATVKFTGDSVGVTDELVQATQYGY